MNNVTHNFLGIPDIPLREAKFLVLPVPFEATTSCLPGTKEGPSAIIAASNYVELYDEELDAEPYLSGIRTLPQEPPDYSSLKRMVSSIRKTASRYAGKGRIIAGLGGEHTVTLGLVKACRETCPGLRVVSLDAHADLRDSYQGTGYSHACVMRRVVETGSRVYTAGVRSISREEKEFLDGSSGMSTVLLACKMGDNWDESFDRMLPPGDYYLSVDVDFLDPSVMPETGTPEPGGFFWNDTMRFLRRFIMRRDVNISGFDVVELSPVKSVTPSSFLAAKLVYRIIGLLAAKNGYLKQD